MARHKLTKAEQLRGVIRALDNPKTPRQFIPGLQKRFEKLKHDVGPMTMSHLRVGGKKRRG